MIALILHGGCHDLVPSPEEIQAKTKALNKYGEIGMSILSRNASAVEAIEEVISMLEDDPLFDAGTGSFTNLNGEVEMDALIMKGDGDSGGVICIKNVKNPIKVARKVMEQTPHILLSGKGAEDFARTQGFPFYNLAIQNCEEEFIKLEERRRMLCDIQLYIDHARKNDHIFSTVGMVALDNNGLLAAATSTGGIRMKMPGRVGDSAIPGAGTYCNSDIGLSATGEGEGIIRLCLTHSIAMDYSITKDLAAACKSGISKASNIDCISGVIALTAEGEFCYAHNGTFMPVYMNKI